MQAQQAGLFLAKLDDARWHLSQAIIALAKEEGRNAIAIDYITAASRQITQLMTTDPISQANVLTKT